jgi:hypothetical protein
LFVGFEVEGTLPDHTENQVVAAQRDRSEERLTRYFGPFSESYNVLISHF